MMEVQTFGEPFEIIPAKTILEKIAKGEPVEHDRVIVKGDIDTRKIEVMKHYNKISNLIIITNSKIDGFVNFEGAEFKRDINFSGTCFKNIVDFSNAKFGGNAYFGTSKFNDNGYFTGSIFIGRAHFWQAQFKKDASFIECNFINYADFRSAIINKYANFTGSTFKELADFKGAIFKSYANFSKIEFFKDLIFTECNFNGDFDLINSKCKGNVHIVKTTFNGITNFNDSIFDEIVNLEESLFKNLYLINLSLNRTLYIKNAEFKTIHVSWELIRKKLICDGTVYKIFIKNFLNLEQSKEADNCYYDYKEWGRNQKNFGYPKIADWLSKISYGYGVRPFRPLFIGVIIVGIFSIIYWKFNAISDSQAMGIYIQDPMWRAAYYSALSFIANSKSIPWNEPFEWLGLVESFIGWLLMALFLVTLSRTRMR